MKPFYKRVQRGEIYWCDLGEAVGSEQGGCRPVIIVQNDIGNNYSTTTIVVPLTTKLKKTKLPTHHEFVNNGVAQVACAEQIRTVDKLRLGTNLGFVRKEDVDKISQCVHIAVEEIDFQPKIPHKNSGVPSSRKKQQGLGKNQTLKTNIPQEEFLDDDVLVDRELNSTEEKIQLVEKETAENRSIWAEEQTENTIFDQNQKEEVPVKYVEKNSEEQRRNQELFFQKRAEELRLKKEQLERKKSNNAAGKTGNKPNEVKLQTNRKNNKENKENIGAKKTVQHSKAGYKKPVKQVKGSGEVNGTVNRTEMSGKKEVPNPKESSSKKTVQITGKNSQDEEKKVQNKGSFREKDTTTQRKQVWYHKESRKNTGQGKKTGQKEKDNGNDKK